MPVVTIRDVPINFPFEPYELQKDYMEKVLECLQNEMNGVLESPTGTGKTLSLLCSSLAWLEVKKAQLQMQREIVKVEKCEYVSDLQQELDNTAGKTTGRSFLGLPTIIYASRTHSQLSQAMQELKRTSYKYMKACVLGSRDFMCIHPDLKDESVQVKRTMCELKVKSRSCQYHNRVEQKKFDPALTQLDVVDIEDIVKLGKAHTFCPFFMTKELKQRADIIFMPYNYLLDPLIRKGLGIELGNSVVILDEAHNIEKHCEEAASLQIKSSDITLAIEEVTAVMKIISEDNGLIDMSEETCDITPEDLCHLKETLLSLEQEIDNVKLVKSTEGTNFEGTYIFELLGKAQINNKNCAKFIRLIDDITQFLSTMNEGPFARKGGNLRIFQDFLAVVFASNAPACKDKVNLCYKVHIIEEEVKKKKASNWQSKATAKSGGRVLSYWCFNPGFGMNMLMNFNLKSLILTSGTLAPLKPLISELGINVPVRLENPHIVKGNQICVKIICNGPDSETLNSNFQNRDNPAYMGSLGRAILNLCRIIPKGLLIFFPSYPTMEKCAQYWQESGIWGNICQIKQILMEPRDKHAFSNAMTEYYSRVQDPTLKGAIFMGVCRGKLSEGLDFADDNGRAVILTGLPYPPMKDPKIILKRRYMDRRNAEDREYLKGDEWYSLEATRAVNQAIGRVIRHCNDYGAILLLDMRFNNFRAKSQMSRWLQEHIKTVKNFGEAVRDLRVFFKNAATTVEAPTKAEAPLPPPQIKTEINILDTYRKGNFDFSSSSLPSTSSVENATEVVIHKRIVDNSLPNPKRKKITLIQNRTESFDVKTSPKEYIVMVQNKLDASSFRNFTEALKVYKETCNFGQFIHLLDQIFINKCSLRYLILGLEPYIKEHHKDDFQKYWETIK